MIVAGAPASGKTLLANRLSKTLQLPLICRDPITEALAEALQPRTHPDMAPITQASFRVFYGLIADQLDRGVGVVCETNFHRGAAEAELRPVIAHARAVLVHCQVDRELSIRRFIERFERGERHWCCFDGERIAEIREGRGLEAWDRAEPLDLGVPVLAVDTNDGYDPEIEEIVRFVLGSAGTIDSPAPTVAPMSDPQPPTPNRQETATADSPVARDAARAPAVRACPALGFVDDPANRYSHPTHLHRCFAGISPLRLSTQQQRELCLTHGFVACPRLSGAHQADPAFAATARSSPPARVRSGLTPSLASPEPEGLTHSLGSPQPGAPDNARAPAPIAHHFVTTANIVRGIVAGVGFLIGVCVVAVTLLLVFSTDRLDLSPDDLSRVAADTTTSVRPVTGVRDAGRTAPTLEPGAVDVSPSTAGIQQAAAAVVESTPAAVPTVVPTSAPTVVPTAGPTTNPQAETPARAPVRRATIRAPEGFSSAFLRDAPATSARSLTMLANGTPIEVLEGTAAGDGFTWAHVRTQDGTTGWMVSTAVSG